MNSHSNDIWYVLVDGQSYGPFTADVMVGFVAETRVVASSLISQHPHQGYVAAADHHAFREWLHAASQRPTHQAEAQMSQAQGAQTQDVILNEHAQTVYIVMAEIDPKTGMSFLRKLQGFGHAQRIGDTVWLLQTAHNLNDVKSTLAATLSKRDRLFIHDCFANQQSWENIGADLDDRIRQMWQTVER